MKLYLISIASIVISFTDYCHATVNIVVNTYDGIVVAADSRIASSTKGKSRILTEFGQKIVRVGSHALITFAGTAHLYDSELHLRSIGSIMEEYLSKSSIDSNSHVPPDTIADGLNTLLMSYLRLNEENLRVGNLAVYVCGYDLNMERNIIELVYSREKIHFTEKTMIRIDKASYGHKPKVLISGQTKVFSRLIKGYDPVLAKDSWFKEVEVIAVDSLDSTIVDTTIEKERLDFKKLQIKTPFGQLTLQDAIDFAVFIVRATIEFQRFDQSSSQGVGGAIDIAVITTVGFQWIQRKELHGEKSKMK